MSHKIFITESQLGTIVSDQVFNIKNIDEGNSSLTVDDYIVFDPSQVQIVRKYRK